MSAVISADERYRYHLRRELPLSLDQPTSRTCLFIMLNPSTADAAKNDPTIRRCLTFTSLAGCDVLEVVNLYAYRATDPDDLFRAGAAGVDIVGPDNYEHIEQANNRADVVYVAWGAKAPRDRVAALVNMCGMSELHCLGTTSDGSPRHPLYVPTTAAVELWSPNA
ncbi:hypothetical protein CH300_20065 [Rhodococcus sp. 15-1154-1]|nr:DUF1643 domain-containing protein [Rhodococcus sp. 15-1154-1]OZF00838.1 hypothetical protein CH300_20065 [Rhodococcus sp. 15-1154-1]